MPSKKLRRKTFLKKFGSHAIVNVDPRHVEYYSGTKFPTTKDLRLKLRRAPSVIHFAVARLILDNIEEYVVPEKYFVQGKPLEDINKYKKVSDFILNMESPEKSIWFSILMNKLESCGIAIHKNYRMRSREEILKFLNSYRDNVVKSIMRKGFLETYTGWESTGIIDASGCIRKTASGDHRFFIARESRVTSFPLKVVGIHEDWVRNFQKESAPLHEAVHDSLSATREKYSTKNSSNIARASERTLPRDSTGGIGAP